MNTTREFTFMRDGDYTDRAPLPRPAFQRRAPRRNAGWGATCPGCGCARSVANVCECNAG